jgi:hypothetical protein
MTPRVLAALALMLTSCGGEDERPDPYVPPFTDNLAACQELADATPSGGEVFWHGQPAGCAVDGLECPLPAVFAPACDQGVPYAECRAQRWVLRCVTIAPASDGGNTEAGAP